MSSKTKALKEKIKAPFRKVRNYLRENDRKNKEAAKEMDRRYPSGWAQSESNMVELRQIKKGIK